MSRIAMCMYRQSSETTFQEKAASEANQNLGAWLPLFRQPAEPTIEGFRRAVPAQTAQSATVCTRCVQPS